MLEIVRQHDTDGETGISFDEFKEMMLEDKRLDQGISDIDNSMFDDLEELQ